MKQLLRALRAPLISLALLLASGSDSLAATAAQMPQRSLRFDGLTAFQLGPTGLGQFFGFCYRQRLYDSSSLLLKDSFVELAVTTGISPANVQPGLRLIVQPLALLQLSADYSTNIWFGNFGFLQSFASPQAEVSTTALAAGEAAGHSYAASGQELKLAIVLQGLYQQVALRNKTSFLYTSMQLKDGDHYYYNFASDLLLHNDSWIMFNDTDLVYLTDYGLAAGMRVTLMQRFAPAAVATRNPQPAQDILQKQGPMLRLGPLLAWRISDQLHPLFRAPTLIVIANWWLRHPWRSQSLQQQLFPYLAIAFSFEGELWHSNK